MKRTKLSQRQLPDYTPAEEKVNVILHLLGICLGVAALVLCLGRASDSYAAVAAWIYGGSMTLLYSISSIYHGLRPSMGKKVLQVLDHCTIYLLIAGSYTPITLCAFRPVEPILGWGMLAFQWGLAAVAITLTAIDLKCYRVFSMTCYVGMGWAVLPFLDTARQLLQPEGFGCLLLGGIAYTLGAVLYGIGSKRRWFHCLFHGFVLLGSALQLVCMVCYVFSA